MRTIGNRLPFWRVAALALLALASGMGTASAQGKRLGLVIGLADYGETKHPTALQDAGLVAQSLKQAGFDLTEAANLSQSEFRGAFRDFSERAASAGPDTVVAIYISGVGLQDDGENILIPVGARLRQRSDLALEGLRVSDFLRSLSGIRLGARIVMLDAAYTHPYGQLVAEGGRGFAPVEKRDGILVSFNQSPDQVAALPRTNYGNYAMALAEALREPGSEINAVFERVRLRAHDLSQGAETPWHINGLTAPLVLVPGAAGGAPIASQTPEYIEARRKPIGQLGGDDAYARAVEFDTIPVYEEFVKAYPTHAQTRRVRAMIAARREAYYWQRARRANTDRAYWTYLRRYPRGAHAGEAESRLSRLSAPLMPPPQFEEVIYDDLPPPLPEEIEIYEAVVADDRWDMPPPSGYSVHFLPPPPVEIIELAPPPPNPSSRLLPAVVIGAGVIGAAILVNRAWRRPEPVRPIVAPPIVRPPRPPVGPGGVRPPIGQPPIGQPPVVRPQPPVGVVNPPVVPPGVRPPVSPPVGVGGPPGSQPPVGVVTPPTGQPGSIRPVTGGSVPPVGGVAPRPGAIMPVTPGGTVPPVGGTQRPGGPPPAVASPPAGQPLVASPPAGRPAVPPPNVQRPPAVQNPNIGPRPPTPPTPPGGGPPQRNIRQVPLTQQQPQVRQAPPQVRQAPPQPRYMPVPQRQAPPQVRQAPPPQVRQAPPAYRPPPPQVRQVAPPPQIRAAPPPQVRAAPPAAPRACTPQMRAARQC